LRSDAPAAALRHRERKCFLIAIARGVVTANTHERQVIQGVSAGNLTRYALSNLQEIRAGIGQAGPSAPQAATPAERGAASHGGPCALLTASEAAAAMRSSVLHAREDSMETCFYGSQSAAGDGVSLQLIDGGCSKFDFDHSRLGSATTLNDIGDEAFEFVSLAGFVQVYVLKGNQYLAITLTNRRDPNARYSANEIARQIADRIPR
jgi:hypothetical protein